MKLPEPTYDGNVYAGTFGGMLVTVCSNVIVADLLRTVLLAVVGAVVSFVVSLILKRLFRHYNR